MDFFAVQNQNTNPEKKTTKFRTQDFVALGFLIILVLAASFFGIESWNHWRETKLPTLPDSLGIIDKQEKIEKDLATIRFNIEDLKKNTIELQQKLVDAKKVFDPGPPPESPKFWNWSNAIDGVLSPYEVGGKYAWQLAKYEANLKAWKVKKAVYDEANSQIAKYKKSIDDNTKQISNLLKKDDKFSSELRGIRDRLANEQARQSAAELSTSAWNDWIGPIMHLSLNWALFAVSVNLVIRLILLRGWIGVGRI